MADFGIGEIGAAASIIGTGVSAIGAITGAQAQAAQARYSAQVAANNATIAGQNANYAVAAGEAKATDQAMMERARAGAVRAALASHGVDVNTGSAVDVQETGAETGQVDVERQRQEAALRAYGYRTQAVGFTAEQGLETARASSASTAGFLKAGGTLLSGIGSIGGKWAALQTPSTSSADAVASDIGA